MIQCKYNGCAKLARTAGFCSTHYSRDYIARTTLEIVEVPTKYSTGQRVLDIVTRSVGVIERITLYGTYIINFGLGHKWGYEYTNDGNFGSRYRAI